MENQSSQVCCITYQVEGEGALKNLACNPTTALPTQYDHETCWSSSGPTLSQLLFLGLVLSIKHINLDNSVSLGLVGMMHLLKDFVWEDQSNQQCNICHKEWLTQLHFYTQFYFVNIELSVGKYRAMCRQKLRQPVL